MSFANGKYIPSTKINRGVTRTEVSHASRCQTREATFTSEDFTESNHTSTKVVKTQRVVCRTSSNRDPMFNRMLAARRLPKNPAKKHVDSAAPENAVKPDSDQKPATRTQDNPAAFSSSPSQPSKNRVFYLNGGAPRQPDQKLVNSSRVRDSPMLGKFRMQNGWIRPSPSPLAIRIDGQLGRRTQVIRDSANPAVTDGSLTMRSSKTQITGPTKPGTNVNHRLGCVTDANEGLDPPKREYTTDCVISAWLLQCNNASIMLDGTDSADEGEGEVVVKQVVEEDSGILVPDASEFETSQPRNLPDKENPPSSIKQTTTQLEAFFTAPVPNKLAQSSQFVRSPTYVELRHPNGMDDTVPLGKPFDSSASVRELKHRMNDEASRVGEPFPRDEFNSVNAQDWTSVSSSEWGDDMCEFDRQQSQRVREMFEEIDRMLFDSPVQESSTVKTRSSSHPTFEDKPDADFDMSHLKGECEDWLSRFPHLRVVGTQIASSRDPGYEFHSSTKLDTRSLKALSNLNLDENPEEAQVMHLVGTSSVPNLLQMDATHESSHSGALEDSSSYRITNAPTDPEYSTPQLNAYGAQEEILAIDGQYEEVIVIDHGPSDDSSSLTPRRKRRARRRRDRQAAHADSGQKTSNSSQLPPKYHGQPAITGEHSGDQTANTLCQTFVELLVKEINSDLVSWLRAFARTEASNDDANSVDRCNVSASDFTASHEFSAARNPRDKGNGDGQVAPCAIHSSKVLNEETSMTPTNENPTDPEGPATNLTGLLQISTKTLQQRERTFTNELPDFSNRINAVDQVNSLPGSSWMTQTNRSSPQPIHCCSMTPVSSRPLSGAHVKTIPSSSRKTAISNGSASGTDAVNAGGTGPSVIGVAASFHPVGRLAPLDRVRTPCGFHPVGSHVTDEFVSTLSEASSHVIHRINKNPFNPDSHGVSLSQPCSIQQHASPLNQTAQAQTNSMMTHPATADHPSGRGCCTLPPLGSGVVTSGVVLGSLGQSSISVPPLPTASRSVPNNARLGSVTQTGNLHQQNVNAQQQLQPQHATQSHAPALRGTSANLVTQQINNSGLLFMGQGQRTWTRTGPRSTRTKQTTAPSLLKGYKKTWRPQTSISTNQEKQHKGLPQVFDRSSSTLLIRRIVDPYSECNSPRKPPPTTAASRTDRINGIKFSSTR